MEGILITSAVPAHHKGRSCSVPSQTFWYRWLAMQIVATARLRTAIIIAVREYERDCTTLRIRRAFSAPETVKPSYDGYHEAIHDMFPEIPGVQCETGGLDMMISNAVRLIGRKELQPHMDKARLFKRATQMADFLLENEAWHDEAGLILHDWFSEGKRAKRRMALLEKNLSHQNSK